MMIQRRLLEVIVDIIGEILAFFTVFLLLFMLINGKFQFLPEDITAMMTHILFFAIIVILGLKGLEFSLKRSWLLTIVFGALVVGVIVFLFFPEALPTWFRPEDFAGMLKPLASLFG